MVQNFALAAIVALFATATLAAPSTEAVAHPSEATDAAKAGTEAHADAHKQEEPKKEEKK